MKKSKEERQKAFIKLTKCVLGCKTEEQVESCYTMIDLYSKMFSDHTFDIKSEVEVLKDELAKLKF